MTPGSPMPPSGALFERSVNLSFAIGAGMMALALIVTLGLRSQENA